MVQSIAKIGTEWKGTCLTSAQDVLIVMHSAGKTRSLSYTRNIAKSH